jgi:hypothetical protein
MATIRARRRPIRNGAERNNELIRRMSSIPCCAGRKHSFREQSAGQKHGPAPNACRERRKNSNASFVRPLIHSGFIAAIRPPTLEIFYRKFPASCSTRRSKPYPGANPKARSKRLT